MKFLVVVVVYLLDFFPYMHQTLIRDGGRNDGMVKVLCYFIPIPQMSDSFVFLVVVIFRFFYLFW